MSSYERNMQEGRRQEKQNLLQQSLWSNRSNLSKKDMFMHEQLKKLPKIIEIVHLFFESNDSILELNYPTATAIQFLMAKKKHFRNP